MSTDSLSEGWFVHPDFIGSESLLERFSALLPDARGQENLGAQSSAQQAYESLDKLFIEKGEDDTIAILLASKGSEAAISIIRKLYSESAHVGFSMEMPASTQILSVLNTEQGYQLVVFGLIDGEVNTAQAISHGGPTFYDFIVKNFDIYIPPISEID